MDLHYRFFSNRDSAVSCAGLKRALAQACFQKWLIKAKLTRFFERVRPHAASNPFAIDFAVGIFVAVFKLEKILRDDHVAFHADDFGDLSCSA